MMRRHPCLGAVGHLLVLGAVSSSIAHAQSAEAEALFNEGNRLFAAGQTAEACEAFDGSNKLEQRAGTLIRLGECREKQGRRASAWSAYRDALSRVKDPNKKRIAEERVTALEPTLSKVTLVVPDVNRVVGLEVVRNGTSIDSVLWNRTVPIDGGAYTVIARAAGHIEQVQTVTIPDEGGNVTITIPRLEHVVVVEPVLTPVPTPNPPAEPSMWTGQRTVAVAIGGIAVVAFFTGTVLGSGANGLEDDAYLLCPDPQMPCANADRANDLIDRATTRSRYANISFGVGATAAIAAAILWFTGSPDAPATESRRVGLVPVIAPDHVGASYEVRF